jgi:hypothetical protein
MEPQDFIEFWSLTNIEITNNDKDKQISKFEAFSTRCSWKLKKSTDKKCIKTIKKEREKLTQLNKVEELLKIGSPQVNIFHSPVHKCNKITI